MDEELKKALADLGVSTLAEANAKVKEALDEFRSTSEANDKARDAVVDEKLAKLEAELDKYEDLNKIITEADARAKADKEELQERYDELEARLNRPGAGADAEKAEAKKHMDAFLAYARRDAVALVGDYQNVLQVGDDTAAGYLAPTELVMDILKEVEEISPMRGFVTVRRTGNRSISMPKRTSLPEAVFVGETEDRPDTEGLAYGMDEIPTFESTMAVPVTNAMLEDDEFNLEDEIREAVSLAYGKQEGRVIISGTGANQPQGILNAAGTIGVNSGLATEITADNVIDLKYAVKTAYAQNGIYTLNRSTLGKIRKMKDGNGQYLWAAGLADARPNTIDGEPYVEMPDMPNVGAGLKPIAFGDFRRGYTLVDRLDMAMMRDPYTRAGNGQVLFRWRRRFGGKVRIAEAIAVLTVAA